MSGDLKPRCKPQRHEQRRRPCHEEIQEPFGRDETQEEDARPHDEGGEQRHDGPGPDVRGHLIKDARSNALNFTGRGDDHKVAPLLILFTNNAILQLANGL